MIGLGELPALLARSGTGHGRLSDFSNALDRLCNGLRSPGQLALHQLLADDRIHALDFPVQPGSICV